MESSWDFRDVLYGSNSPLHCATVWICRVPSLPQREGGNIDNPRNSGKMSRCYVQVELYMAELYNKIGLGLITWSPISLGLCSSKPEDQFTLFTKLAVKVRVGEMFYSGLEIIFLFCLQSGKYNKGGIDMLNLNDGRAPNEATLRVKQLEAVSPESWCLDLAGLHISYLQTKFLDSVCLNFSTWSHTHLITGRAGWELDNSQHSDFPSLFQIAERLGVCLGQLVVAWAIRNATSQCVILSANTADQMVTLLNSLQVKPFNC